MSAPRTRRIPNGLSLVISTLALGDAAYARQLLSSIGGGLCAPAVFGLIVVMTRQIGLGDLKLAISIGLVVGRPAVLSALYAGMLMGAIVTVVLIGSRVIQLQDSIAYGICLCLGLGLYWLTECASR